jgi:serine/threonine protein kinase
MQRTVKTYCYDDETLLGEGGFARVYLAKDDRREGNVALKILKEEFESNRQVVRSFFQDPEIMISMNHNNIVHIFDIGSSAEKPFYLSMEYCNGGDLRKLLECKHKLSFCQALQTGVAICDALTHCHQQGLVHRDIKASNILFRDEFSPVLTDFSSTVGDINNAGTGVPQVGSPPYLPPEVWEGKAYNVASDLYSLGVVFYYMLTGRLPFIAETAEEFMRLHIHASPVPASSWRPGIEKDLDDIIAALLDKDPSNRIPTAEELKSQLLRIQERYYSDAEQQRPLRLILYDRSHRNTDVSITQFPFRIGKHMHDIGGQRNDLVIGSEDPFVSRSHAVIEKIDDSFFFTDVSTNGSTVNGANIHKQSIELMKENDITLGASTTFSLQVVPEERSRRTEQESNTSILLQPFVEERPRFIARMLPAAIALLALFMFIVATRLSCR